MPATPDPARRPSPDAVQTASSTFDEALRFGPLGWFAVAGLVVTLWIALLPVDLVLATAVAAVAAVVAVLLVVRWTPRVRVRGGELVAGRAHIPLDLLRAPRALAGAELREALGPGLDARAYVCLRGWVHSAVRVDVDDPQDPTPYWIVSTRRPDELVAALTRG
ncbi:DUF3093 domain-containing protein [Cellulomonas persica]|uniref:DUF3093 domain-containing protein n=1 Tax=Cellulomonas persica TaxID=76861 RepID=A0A510UQC1_9CELL|nr:DUF3093 domain-containing protein [Cellulomonas persica]GEK16676.1 hypothetical protein CPE01_04090 [Cellulomonas persica]